MTKAAIIGLAGTELSAGELDLLRTHQPAGVILFARNIQNPDQLNRLTSAVHALLQGDPIVMVDQEGGRVARLRPPHWRAHPPASSIGALPGEQGERAAWLTGALIGLDCARAGFNVVCAPVLDLRFPGAHDIIGDRAFSTDAAIVARLGRAMAEGMLAAGVQPVAKHIPGHGRATVDSHLELPRVDATELDDDLLAFAANADLPWAMTAHILYPVWDAERPATLSPTVIDRIIRRRIGFDGVLISDDLAMQALSGTPADLANAALAAGCDLVLHCTGDSDETADLLRGCPPVSDQGTRRMQAARVRASRSTTALDASALAAERTRLLA